MLKNLELVCVTVGRGVLGLYFIVPGALLKIFNIEGTAEYMAEHGMIFIPFFLFLTIAIQLAGGIALVVGYQTRPAAFVLAGLTLAISIVLHDFWNIPEETQNFIKNMGISGGLLVAAGLGAGDWSLDNRLSRPSRL